MTYEKKLTDFLSTCDGRVRDVFFSIYSIIDSLDEKEQASAVMYVCENVYKIRSDHSNRITKDYYTAEQVAKAGQIINQKFTPILEYLIEKSAKNSVAPIDFYSKAWELIQSSIFRTKRDRALALFSLADHELIPYRGVGNGMTMENEKYQSIVDVLKAKVLDDTNFILKMDFDQKTQRASLLVDRLLSLESKEEQAVYMAVLINTVENNIKENLKAALDDV